MRRGSTCRAPTWKPTPAAKKEVYPGEKKAKKKNICRVLGEGRKKGENSRETAEAIQEGNSSVPPGGEPDQNFQGKGESGSRPEKKKNPFRFLLGKSGAALKSQRKRREPQITGR